MSSWPGSKLEDAIWDTYGTWQGQLPESIPRKTIAPELLERLVVFYEPHRDTIEYRLNDYSEDNGISWRDYKYLVLWEGIPEPPKEVFSS